MKVRGVVINIHHHGATVRLEDGTLASVTAAELERERSRYAASLGHHRELELVARDLGRRRTVVLDDAGGARFEAQLASFLKDSFERTAARATGRIRGARRVGGERRSS